MKGEENLKERLEQKLGPDHGTVIHLMLGEDPRESCTCFALDAEKFPDLVKDLDDLLNEFDLRGVAHIANHPLVVGAVG